MITTNTTYIHCNTIWLQMSLDNPPQPADPAAPGPYGQPGRVELTAEERRVMAACNSESFWYRSLPGTVLFGFLARSAVQTGMLRGNPTYGATPKMVVGGILGFFAGKLSYVAACREKFLTEAPDSNIAQAIRAAAQGLPPPGWEEPAEPQQAQQAQQSPVYQNQASPTFGQQPGLLGGYDELRRRNREAGQNQPFQQLNLPPDPTPPALPAQPDYPASKLRPAKQNKYGDEGFE